MQTIAFSEFRKNASRILSAVEKGEVFVVLRHGRPVAEIAPVTRAPGVPSWRRPGLRLAVKGAELSSAVMEERLREDVF
jgi:antitoxin (DNA-binding transcriptional repressor) of toxin-antitoxin stability system